MSHQSENWRSVWAWVISTPFGAPVVPDVNSTSETSSARTACPCVRRPPPRRRGPRAQERVEGVVGFARVVEADDEVEGREVGAKVGEGGGVVHAEELARR